MNRGLLVFLAISAFTTAMVPRNRRAVNSEEQHDTLLLTENSTPATTTQKEAKKLLCAPKTPCGWSIYKSSNTFIEMNITNTYCDCSPGTKCQVHEDDSSVNAWVHRCKPQPETEEVTES